jgi:hypothetical protein
MPTLNWLNRQEAVSISSKVPYRMLKSVPELSYGECDSQNMLIQGDNLDTLKALLPYFAGQVKCIYIVIWSLFANVFWVFNEQVSMNSTAHSELFVF